MQRRGLSTDDAFDVLSQSSQRLDVKV
ncbi:hypothetical protein [Longispora sp. K20-0274]